MSLHVREFGRPGQPVLVALHGFLGTGENWAELAERADVHLYAPDLPGHGKTGARPEGFADAIALLEAWAQRQQISDALLLGYSMGGRLALGWAPACPARWRTIVLEGASPGIANPAERTLRATLDDARARDLLERGLSDFLDDWQALPLFKSQQLLPPMRQAKMRALRERSRPEGLAWAIAALSPGRQPDYAPRLGEMAMPAHLITGERDEKFSAIAEQMRRSIPDSAHHVIPGAGHCTHFEKPDQYAAVLGEILREERRPGVIAC